MTVRHWLTNMKKIAKITAILLCVCIFVGLLAACQPEDKPEEFDYTDLTVRDYKGANGVVTAASPYAAKAGLTVLEAGGNAFDAAVAVSFAIGVAECDATGLGGGGLMLAYNVNTQKSLYYNFREFAPGGVTLADYSDKITNDTRCRETAVPTQLIGLARILEEQGSGTKTLADVMAPAIDLAENGIVVTPELAVNIRDYYYQLQDIGGEQIQSIFCPNGIEPLLQGEKLVQSDLADTLRYIAENGVEGFYKGELAQKIVDAAQAHGGKLSMEDMQYAYDNYYHDNPDGKFRMVSTPLTGTYKDEYTILTPSSPSRGGTVLIEMLNMLECYQGSIKDLGHNSAEYVNLLATVMQLAFGDEQMYIGDANYVSVPTEGLTSKQYAAERFAKYNANKAYLGTAENGGTELPYGDAWKYDSSTKVNNTYQTSGSHYSTTSFSVADKDGNLVTFTQTINNFFGSRVMPEGTGFFLNNEIKDFAFTEGAANVVAPYKQSASYMAPSVVLRNGKPFLTVGSPGANRIPSAILQVILNMVEFDMNVVDAIGSPRVHCFTTDSSDSTKTSKVIYMEKSLSDLTESLTKLGYSVSIQGNDPIASYFGGVQAISVISDGYHGAADFRRDGKALGY